MPTSRDYDTEPERYRLGMQLSASHRAPGVDLYARIAALLHRAGARLVLDLGAGDGALAAACRPGPGAADASAGPAVVSLDAAGPMVRAARRHGPVVQADVTALPVLDAVADAAVAVNVLDHLPDPILALREARRVLRPGALLVAGAISRDDSPELAPHWRPCPTPFDAEDAPSLVEHVFGAVRVERWDAPLITLPTREALRDYLVARFVPVAEAAAVADRLGEHRTWPLPVTKRGALVLGRRPPTRVPHDGATRLPPG